MGEKNRFIYHDQIVAATDENLVREKKKNKHFYKSSEWTEHCSSAAQAIIARLW